MIRLLLAGTALATLMVGGPAMAADQAVKAPMFTKAPMIPVFSWTGFYIGGNAGGHWGQDNISTTTNVPNAGAGAAAALDLASPATVKPTGWLAGGQVGYNVQVNHAVLGFEGDADWVNGSASRTLTFAGPLPAAGDVLTDTTQSNFLGTLRPRLGAAFDHSLLYITGGLAVGTVNTTDSFAKFGGTIFEQASATATRLGWVAGGGFEYAFLDNWSAKIEALHVDLGGTYDTGIPCATICAAGAGTDIVVHHKYTDNIVRFGLNYRLGATPVVAKY
jgi:outer membrane immunogenic protein